MIGLKGIPFPAGIENFTEQVSWRLAARGHEVTVYVRPYVEVGDEYRGIRIRRQHSINTKHLDAISHTLLASLDVLSADADIVHYHALGPSVLSFLPRLRGVKTIAHVHGLDWQRAKWSALASQMLQTAEYSAVYFPNRTITISTTLKRYFEEKFGTHVDYVPTGVEPIPYREPQDIRRWGLERGSYILFLSRLVPEKGCHYLLDAYSRLTTTKRLVVAGPAAHPEAYAASLQQKERPNVSFVGPVTGRTLEELFGNAYVYVLPSEIEGLPHAILQALSAGCCVLASDNDGNLEALGPCGLTFRNRDVDDLTAKLQYLLDNPEFVAACAPSAHARVRETYTWDSVVDRLEAVYQGCLAPQQTVLGGAH
jgi:glycosyltransferase involved in cell wall biosynthesis